MSVALKSAPRILDDPPSPTLADACRVAIARLAAAGVLVDLAADGSVRFARIEPCASAMATLRANPDEVAEVLKEKP